MFSQQPSLSEVKPLERMDISTKNPEREGALLTDLDSGWCQRIWTWWNSFQQSLEYQFWLKSWPQTLTTTSWLCSTSSSECVDAKGLRHRIAFDPLFLALIFHNRSFLYPLAYYVEGLDVFRSMTHFTSVSIVLRILYRLAFAWTNPEILLL